MLKRHEVEILLKAHHSKAEVARLAGVSLRSVKRIAEEAPVVHVDDAVEREKRRISRPSIVGRSSFVGFWHSPLAPNRWSVSRFVHDLKKQERVHSICGF